MPGVLDVAMSVLGATGLGPWASGLPVVGVSRAGALCQSPDADHSGDHGADDHWDDDHWDDDHWDDDHWDDDHWVALDGVALSGVELGRVELGRVDDPDEDGTDGDGSEGASGVDHWAGAAAHCGELEDAPPRAAAPSDADGPDA